MGIPLWSEGASPKWSKITWNETQGGCLYYYLLTLFQALRLRLFQDDLACFAKIFETSSIVLEQVKWSHCVVHQRCLSLPLVGSSCSHICPSLFPCSQPLIWSLGFLGGDPIWLERKLKSGNYHLNHVWTFFDMICLDHFGLCLCLYLRLTGADYDHCEAATHMDILHWYHLHFTEISFCSIIYI